MAEGTIQNYRLITKRFSINTTQGQTGYVTIQTPSPTGYKPLALVGWQTSGYVLSIMPDIAGYIQNGRTAVPVFRTVNDPWGAGSVIVDVLFEPI